MKRIGYLCSEFPGISHTFISREISILQRLGYDIRTATINPTRNLEKMGAEDQAFAAKTYCVKATPKRIILGRLLAYALKLPSFLRAWAFAAEPSSGPFSSKHGKPFAYLLEAVLLHAWARREGLSHVHVHFANPAATVAMIATKFGGLEFSLSLHGPDEFYHVDSLKLRTKISKAVFVRCIGHYCRSQAMYLSRLEDWTKLHIVRCGLYKGEFVPRPARKGPARKILCVGRLCAAKGQAILVEAAASLRAKGHDFRLTLLGGGDSLEAVRALATARGLDGIVDIPGPVGHARVKEELSDCDLFVLPSFAEGIPVALMEAMASGVPVISTRITGIPELIEDGVDGFLVPPSDVEGLAQAIEPFLQGKVDTASLTAKAAEKVKRLYDVEANTAELGKIFDSIPG